MLSQRPGPSAGPLNYPRLMATPDVSSMTTEELVREWESTQVWAGPPPFPRFTADEPHRHAAAEAELQRRGFVWSDLTSSWEPAQK